MPDYPEKWQATPIFVRIAPRKPPPHKALSDPTNRFTNRVYKQEQISLQSEPPAFELGPVENSQNSAPVEPHPDRDAATP
jgi:hypothetical protein